MGTQPGFYWVRLRDDIETLTVAEYVAPDKCHLCPNNNGHWHVPGYAGPIEEPVVIDGPLAEPRLCPA